MQSLENHLKILSGSVEDKKVSLYAMVRNEAFFLPAFFDHYRKLGVEQFIVLDDRSTDGSVEFLRKQSDCVMLVADLTYGQKAIVSQEWGFARRERAGVLFKTAIPRKYLANRYAVYADADEFLILPPEVRSLGELIDILAVEQIDCVAAALVEFYPENVAELRRPISAASFEELVGHYPYFDGVPLISVAAGEWPRQVNDSVSQRLFKLHGVREVSGVLRQLPAKVHSLLPKRTPTSAWVKTPIIRWRDGIIMNGSHHANVPPTDKILLAMAHFKFTYDFGRRVDQAMRLKSHARGSQKYFHYQSLISEMERLGSRFTGSNSVQYRGPSSVADAGLTKWAV